MNAKLIGIFLFAPLVAFSQTAPTGLWKTIDDDGKTVKSLVRIAEQDGALFGTVDRILEAGTSASARCDKCSDDRKDKPIVGLQIIRAVRADSEGTWSGGEVLDPKSGKVYRTRLKLVDDGKRLEVRGYLGPFFRTQVWVRAE